MKKIYNLNYIKFIITYSVIFLISLFLFYDHEPGIDQIRHISWSQDIINSSYFFDFNKTSFDELKQQNESFLVNFLKPGYSDVGHLFNLFPIIIFVCLGYLFDNQILIFNLVSITFYIGSIFFAQKIYEILFHKIFKNIHIIIFLILIFSSYYFLHAPLGVHNISLFFNLLVIHCILKNHKNWSNKKIFLLISFVTLAIYSHKINTVLIIPFVFFYFLFNRNYFFLIKYILLQFSVLLPITIIIYLFPETLVSTKEFAQIDISFYHYLRNFLALFKNIFLTVGIIPLFLFPLGIYYMIKNNDKSFILLLYIFIYIFFYIFINSFSVYFVRTNLYINHIVLIIGLFGTISLLEAKIKRIDLIIFIILSFQFVLNFNNVYSLHSKNSYGVFEMYYKNNGRIKDSIHKIDENILKKNEIIFLDNKVQDYYKIYNENYFYKTNINHVTLKNLNHDKKKLSDKFNNTLDNIVIISLTNDEYEVMDNIKIYSKFENSNCKYVLKNLETFLDVGSGGENLELKKIFCD